MKKLVLSLIASVAMLFAFNTASAQKSYIEGQFGYSKYTHTEEVLGTDVDYDFSVMNFNVGYNFAITNNLYLGGMLGISPLSGDDNNDFDATLYTITPKLTYAMPLASGFSWTPNFYVTFGFGSDKILNQDVNYTNIRIGINPLSFDYNITRQFAINANILTPYYNILKYDIKNVDDDSFNDFVFLGFNVGVKFYL